MCRQHFRIWTLLLFLNTGEVAQTRESEQIPELVALQYHLKFLPPAWEYYSESVGSAKQELQKALNKQFPQMIFLDLNILNDYIGGNASMASYLALPTTSEEFQIIAGFDSVPLFGPQYPDFNLKNDLSNLLMAQNYRRIAEYALDSVVSLLKAKYPDAPIFFYLDTDGILVQRFSDKDVDLDLIAILEQRILEKKLQRVKIVQRFRQSLTAKKALLHQPLRHVLPALDGHSTKRDDRWKGCFQVAVKYLGLL